MGALYLRCKCRYHQHVNVFDAWKKVRLTSGEWGRRGGGDSETLDGTQRRFHKWTSRKLVPAESEASIIRKCSFPRASLSPGPRQPSGQLDFSGSSNIFRYVFLVFIILPKSGPHFAALSSRCTSSRRWMVSEETLQFSHPGPSPALSGHQGQCHGGKTTSVCLRLVPAVLQRPPLQQ